MILLLYPNGRAPLTALLTMAGDEPVNDPHFHWWTKNLPQQGGDVIGVYEDTSKTTAHTGGGAVAGDVLYFDVGSGSDGKNLAENFRQDHSALIRKRDTVKNDTNGRVLSTGQFDDNNWYVEVELNEDEDGTDSIGDSTSDLWIQVVGSAHQEHATIPEAVSYDPEEHSNYTQIFRTPLKISRTARQTRLRTGNKYQEQKREILELHGVEMEQALLWGRKHLDTSGNEPRRYTRGILTAILDHGLPENQGYFPDDESGNTWISNGKDWVNRKLERIFRYGDPEKMGLCGSKALQGLNDLAEIEGTMNLEPMETEFGMRLVRWTTPHGDLMLKTHPLMSRDPVVNNDIAVVEPRRLNTRTIQDTIFKEDSERDATNSSRDGLEEEYLTETGLEYDHLETMGYLSGVGIDG